VFIGISVADDILEIYQIREERVMDTSTSYLGLKLPHPFIAGASPFGYRVDDVKRLEDAGCAAVVLHSLFEEQITMDREDRLRGVDALDPDAKDILAQFPAAPDYRFGPDGYAEHIAAMKRAVKIPIIGSLNGSTAESWLTFAQAIEQAGADALEINLYQVASSPNIPGSAIEYEWIRIAAALKRLLKIPIAVKLSPFFTAFANVARQFDEAGVDGLVMFNRFYQSDIDVRTGAPLIHVNLSTNEELGLRLHWLALLFGRVRPTLIVSGGVAVPNDGIKAILAGADGVQMVSALLRHGPTHISAMRLALERWMEWHQIARLSEMRGRSSLKASSDPQGYERAMYIRTLQSWLR
jgi:dihydroorotate dehydrogenase (fumarate)